MTTLSSITSCLSHICYWFLFKLILTSYPFPLTKNHIACSQKLIKDFTFIINIKNINKLYINIKNIKLNYGKYLKKGKKKYILL